MLAGPCHCLPITQATEERHKWNRDSDLGRAIHSLGSSVHGILQARMLEWVAIDSSRGSS